MTWAGLESPSTVVPRFRPHGSSGNGSSHFWTESSHRNEEFRMNSTTAEHSEHSLWSSLIGRLEVRVLALALVLGAALSILSPHFLTSNNLWNVLDQSLVVGIVAIGMTFVILIGGMDLSVGSVAGLTGVLLGRGLEHFPIPVAIVLAIFAGIVIGLFSGTLIARFG